MRANTSSYFFPVRSVAMTHTTVPTLDAGQSVIMGTFRPGAQKAEFVSQVEAQPEVLRYLLAGLLGEPTYTRLSTGGQQYTFRPLSGRKSYTLEVGYRQFARQAVGAYLNSLTFQVSPQIRMYCTLAGVAREVLVPGSRAAGTVQIPSIVGEEAATWDKVTLQVSGTAETAVSDLTMSIQNPVLPLDVQGTTGRVAGFLPSGACQVIMNATILEPTSAWLSYTEKQIPISFSVEMKGTPFGSDYNRITLSMANMRIDQIPANYAVSDALINYRFRAEANAASADPRAVALTIVLSGA